MKKNQFRKQNVSVGDIGTMDDQICTRTCNELRDMGKLGKAKRVRNRWLRLQHMANVMSGRVAA